MIDRRQFLASAACVAPLAALPAWAQAPAAAPAGDFARLLDDFFWEGLELRPQSATELGLDKGAHAALRSRLSDMGDAGRAAERRQTADQLRRLLAVDRAALAPADRISYDVVLYQRRAAEAVQRFDFGGTAFGPSPYAVSQLTGAYQSVPDFLETKHPVADAADADAYLARLAAFAGQIDANTDRMRHDAGIGVVPPDFILDLTIDQLGRAHEPVESARLVTGFAAKAQAKGLDAKYGREAAATYAAKVLPALDRQIAAAKALRARATHDAGVWKLPNGADFYQVALRNTTTSAKTPDEVHQFGLDQAREITDRLDGLLRKQGMTGGTVGQRMAALYKDPRQLYPAGDAGKAQAIGYCNERLAAVRARLPQAFHRLPPYRFEVRPVPTALEPGAPSAYSMGPAIDGSRPGLVYFNLRDTAEWPKFCLATTVFHEGLPGHQLEGGLALSNTALPLIRKSGGFSGYAEGWALYAEQLADELGLYDDDPLGRLGYLKFQLFRANRCVVDTGIHHLRWGREQAIAYFVDGDGEAPGFAAREVERYCATPGQAASYKLGHSVFTGLRDQARARLGSRFDLKDFHDAVLAPGRVPLEILQQVGDGWIAGQAA